MSHTRLWVAAAIIGLVVIAGFVLSVPHTRDVHVVVPSPASSVPAVTLHDAFKKGVHTITGSLNVPNPCTTVSTQATLQGTASSTQSILVQISLSADSGVCLQVVTRATFQTTLSASAHLPFMVTVNGSVATSTVL
jgi:hypothetical protein